MRRSRSELDTEEYEVLRALELGSTYSGDIARDSGLPSDRVKYALHRLRSRGVIRAAAPTGGWYRRAAACILALTLSACVMARVSPDGAVTGWAIGSARAEKCVERDSTPPERVCVAVAGGALSAQAADLLRASVEAVGGVLRLLLPAGLTQAPVSEPARET